MITSKEIHLAARPIGEPGPDNFRLVTTEVPGAADGQVVVRNTWMSVDPYMRGRMDDAFTFMPPFELGAVLDGAAIGEVIESRAGSVPVGATVSHWLGWREYAVVDAGEVTVIDTGPAPARHYLGLLGDPGLTAYAALTKVAPVKEGDVVFVSAAAGAVGSVAGQLARKLGASRVIGSAGGSRKTKTLLDDFGFDAAVDHQQGEVAKQLAQAAPDGIDVYLDAVGGEHLQAAIGAMRDGGSIALVGAISEYNAVGPVQGPDNLYRATLREISLRGMLVSSFYDLYPEWRAKAAAWLADGSLHVAETVVEGIEQAPEAFLGVMRGVNIGKMLVKLADEQQEFAGT